MKIKYSALQTVVICSLSLLVLTSYKQFYKSAESTQKSIQEKAMNYVTTFKIDKCEKIVLNSYKKMSDSRDGIKPKSKEITDKAVLEKILALINKLPDEGTMMIKMGDVPIIDVILTINKAETVYFTYYQSSIKTPATSFYSDHPSQETQLYNLLIATLEK